MLIFLLFSALCVWIIFFDGAERLEGSITALFVVDLLAPFLSASMLRFYVGILWLGDLIILLVNRHY